MRRPQNLNEYVGQGSIKPILELELKTGSLRPTLLYGPSGIGKSALACAISRSLNSELHEYVASSTWSSDYMIDLLMNLSIEGYDSKGIAGPGAKSHTILVDEIHACSHLETWLLPIETGHVYRDGMPSWLPRINWIICTDQPEKLSAPLLNRMKLQLHLRPYTVDEIGQIITFNFPGLKKALVEDIAKRSKGMPRLAISFSESIALYGGDSAKFFGLMGIDEEGLDLRDRDYLDILREAKRPLSLNTMANSLQETVAITRIMESHLLFLGKVRISGSGRLINCENARGMRG